MVYTLSQIESTPAEVILAHIRILFPDYVSRGLQVDRYVVADILRQQG